MSFKVQYGGSQRALNLQLNSTLSPELTNFELTEATEDLADSFEEL